MPRTTTTTPVAAEDLPDVLRFMKLLWAVVHALDRTSKRMFDDLGVTGPQRLALRVVGLFPGMSASDLAQLLHVHPSTLTGVLQRLVAQRLIHRSDDPCDRRRAVLRLTKRGEHVNAARHGTVETSIAHGLAGISRSDHLATRRVLERLAAHLDAALASRPAPGSTTAQEGSHR